MDLTTSGRDVIIRRVFRRSSMVEQEAVNFEVAGSSPAAGANFRTKNNRGHMASVLVFIQIGWSSWIYFELITFPEDCLWGKRLSRC